MDVALASEQESARRRLCPGAEAFHQAHASLRRHSRLPSSRRRHDIGHRQVLATANVFGWLIGLERIPESIASWLSSVASGPVVLLRLITAILIVVACSWMSVPH